MMTVREEIIKIVATTDDLQLLRDISQFIVAWQIGRNRPPRSGHADVARFAGTISQEDADEMTAIINREFNNIDGGKSLTPPPAPAPPAR